MAYPSISLLLHLFPQHHYHWWRRRRQQHGPATIQLLATTKSLSNHHFLLKFQPHVCRARRSDESNAESFRNFNFQYNSNYGEDEEDYENIEQWTEVLEDYIDSLWILKVFRSYGWLLPFILLSWLLATGFKAFLLALALPIGQSTLFFAFQRLWDQGKSRRKRKAKMKKKRSRSPTWRTSRLDEEWGGSQWTRKKKMGYQSWVPRNDVSDGNEDEEVYNFGGWDELDRGEDSSIGSSRQAQATSRSRWSFTEKGKSSRNRSQGDMPLLLRLLVAVFPFLSSLPFL